MSKWTQFHDMHSGGSLKEKWHHIFIEAPIEEAKVIFYNRFGHNPERVTCTCCGDDYSLSESDSLEQATGYERGCGYDKELNRYVERPSEHPVFKTKYIPLEEYVAREDILVIREIEILPSERTGSVPEQGYVWKY